MLAQARRHARALLVLIEELRAPERVTSPPDGTAPVGTAADSVESTRRRQLCSATLDAFFATSVDHADGAYPE
jgi:hypothetical protein